MPLPFGLISLPLAAEIETFDGFPSASQLNHLHLGGGGVSFPVGRRARLAGDEHEIQKFGVFITGNGPAQISRPAKRTLHNSWRSRTKRRGNHRPERLMATSNWGGPAASTTSTFVPTVLIDAHCGSDRLYRAGGDHWRYAAAWVDLIAAIRDGKIASRGQNGDEIRR